MVLNSIFVLLFMLPYYIFSNYCRCFMIPGSVAFYALFFGPMVIALLLNVIVFLLVVKVIKNTSSAKNDEIDAEMMMVNKFCHSYFVFVIDLKCFYRHCNIYCYTPCYTYCYTPCYTYCCIYCNTNVVTDIATFIVTRLVTRIVAYILTQMLLQTLQHLLLYTLLHVLLHIL